MPQVTVPASQLFRAKSAMEMLMAENRELASRVEAANRLSREDAVKAAECAVQFGEIREVEKAAAVEAFMQDPAAVVELLRKVAADRPAPALGGPASLERGKSLTDPSGLGRAADEMWENEFAN